MPYYSITIFQIPYYNLNPYSQLKYIPAPNYLMQAQYLFFVYSGAIRGNFWIGLNDRKKEGEFKWNDDENVVRSYTD